MQPDTNSLVFFNIHADSTVHLFERPPVPPLANPLTTVTSLAGVHSTVSTLNPLHPTHPGFTEVPPRLQVNVGPQLMYSDPILQHAGAHGIILFVRDILNV